jgi:hypothetical protein
VIRPPLSKAQTRCLLELDRRHAAQSPDVSAWAKPCRSTDTLDVLERRGLIKVRTSFPGGQVQGRVTPAGQTVAAQIRSDTSG